MQLILLCVLPNPAALHLFAMLVNNTFKRLGDVQHI